MATITKIKWKDATFRWDNAIGDSAYNKEFERFDYNFILRDNEEGFKEWFENRSQLASYVHDRFHPLSALDETAVQYFTSEEIGIF